MENYFNQTNFNFIDEYKSNNRLRAGTFDCNSTNYDSSIFSESKIDNGYKYNDSSDYTKIEYSNTLKTATNTFSTSESNSIYFNLFTKPIQSSVEEITLNQLRLFDNLAIIFNIDKNSELGSNYYKLLIGIYKFYNLTDLEIIYFHLFFQKTTLTIDLPFEDNAFFACFFIKRVLNTNNLYIYMRKLFTKYGNEENFLQKFYIWLSTNNDIENKLISIMEVNYYFEQLKELEKTKNKPCNVHIDYNKLIDSFIDNKPIKSTINSNLHANHKLSIRKSSVRSENLTSQLNSNNLIKHLSNQTCNNNFNNDDSCLYKTIRIKKRQDLKEYKKLKLRETPHNPFKPCLNQVDYIYNFQETEQLINNPNFNTTASSITLDWEVKNTADDLLSASVSNTPTNLNNINELMSSPIEDYFLLNDLSWDYTQSRI